MFRAVLCSSSGGHIITASGIVTLCKRPYSTPFESNAEQAKRVYQYKNTKIKLCKNNVASPLSNDLLYGRLQRMTIPDAVIIQYDLLKMSIVLLETCREL